jgi:hypothetical protein
MADKDQLEALKRLDHVWHELRDLLLKCASAKRVTLEDEEQHTNLLRECRVLYGRLSPIIGTAGLESFGRRFDAFQHILGQPSLSAILREEAQGLWGQLWASGASGIGQAIGRVEEGVRQGGATVSPETVARWRWAILSLEAVRRGAIRLFSRPLSLAKLVVDKFEHSLVYRIVAVVVTMGGCIGLIVGLLALVGKLG